MTHASDVASLTDELVHLVRGCDSTSNATVRSNKQTALKTLKFHPYARTNHFNVRTSVDGLVEKFQVVNNDRLANQLQQCVDELETHHYKWWPEALALIIQLSDRPSENTEAQHVETPSMIEPTPLTWTQIFGNSLWTQEYSQDNLHENLAWIEKCDDSDPSVASEVATGRTYDVSVVGKCEEDSLITAASLVTSPDDAAFQSVVQHHSRLQALQQDQSRLVEMTELGCLRNVLHMLLGLATQIFEIRNDEILVNSGQDFCFRHASKESLGEALSIFAALGTDLHVLRSFQVAEHFTPLVRTFASCIEEVVNSFEEDVCVIERSFVTDQVKQQVSLLDVSTRISAYQPLMRLLASIVTQIEKLATDEHYHILDDLYNRVVLAQISDDNLHFQACGAVFGKCWQTYMKSVVKWIDEGEVDYTDCLCPIVVSADVDIARFWNEKYSISTDNDHLKAPSFILSSLKNIFAAGKQVAFLKQLTSQSRSPYALQELCLGSDFSVNQLCQEGESGYSLPFPVLLRNVLNNTIDHNHQRVWEALRKQILWKDGLWSTVEALGELYLCSNGSVFQDFAMHLYAELDMLAFTQLDAYSLESMARHTFGLSTRVNTVRITMVCNRTGKDFLASDIKGLSAIVFSYQYAPSLENIIPRATTVVYQRIFTFLLQLDRAKFLLSNRLVWALRGLDTEGVRRAKNNEVQSWALYHTRHALMWFVCTLQNYIFNYAIAPAWIELQDSLRTAQDMDALIHAHACFITDVERRSLLGKETAIVHDVLLSLLELIVEFVDLIECQLVEGSMPAEEAKHRELSSANNTMEQQPKGSWGTQSNPLMVKGAAYTVHAYDIHSRFQRLHGFAIEGLRTASRGYNAEKSWEILMEALAWIDSTVK